MVGHQNFYINLWRAELLPMSRTIALNDRCIPRLGFFKRKNVLKIKMSSNYFFFSSKVSRSSSLSNSSSGLGRDSHGANIAKMKKPKPTDPLHPNKGDFIRAKHATLAFVYRPAKDEPLVTEAELSRQLHSSVRTPNLETSLRLLSQGADPNFYHPEKNSTPLQVCAKNKMDSDHFVL